MLFVVEFDRENENLIIDRLPRGVNSYKTFLSGTLAEICEELGKKCSYCNKIMKQEDDNTLYTIFSIKDASKTFELICSLGSSKLVEVKNFANVEQFLKITKTVCEVCQSKVKTEIVLSDAPSASEMTVFIPSVKIEVAQEQLDTQTVSTAIETQVIAPATTPISESSNENVAPISDNVTNLNITRIELLQNEEAEPEEKLEQRMTRRRTLGEIEKPLGASCKKCSRAISASSRVTPSALAWSLTQHIKLHSKDYPYKCDFCDYKARQYTSMRHHQQKNKTHKTFTDKTQTDEYKTEMTMLMKKCFPGHKLKEKESTGNI